MLNPSLSISLALERQRDLLRAAERARVQAAAAEARPLTRPRDRQGGERGILRRPLTSALSRSHVR